ncbi:MAG: hypothetical protein FWH16_04150 [Oscillospiraceae bacterium]|nr:hypothetical protein [Oscillospiraceae bacterium]
MQKNFSLALVSAAFLIGAAAGSMTAMTVADGGELAAFFGDMVEGARDGALRNSFWRVLTPNLMWPGMILLFGFSPAGLVGIPACMLVKGFLVSYSVSAIFRAFGLDGIWLALTSIGLPNLVYVPVLVIVSVLGLRATGGARRVSPYFHGLVLGVFIGLAAFQAYLQPRIAAWLLLKYI